jgi:plasmid rolling circle replication initiator protein Rep
MQKETLATQETKVKQAEKDLTLKKTEQADLKKKLDAESAEKEKALQESKEV